MLASLDGGDHEVDEERRDMYIPSVSLYPLSYAVGGSAQTTASRGNSVLKERKRLMAWYLFSFDEENERGLNFL